MASLGDILRGALGGEYNMGRDLDDEERRQIEELRAQGIHVPQERRSAPFRYGAGTVRKKNLADIRAAMQPDQQRRMQELMFQRGRGARDAAAKELRQQQRKSDASQQRGLIKRNSSPRATAERERMSVEKHNRAQAFADQIREKSKARQVAEEQRMQYLRGLPMKSAGERYDLQAGGSIPYRSKEAYVEGATPRISDTERAELAVLQRENLPSRIQEQSLSTARLGANTQALANQVTELSLQDQQRVSKLSAAVQEALPANYVQTMANKQVVSAELAVLLDTQRLKTQQKFGDQLASKSVNKQLSALDLEMANLKLTLEWLESDAGREYQSRGMHIAGIQKLMAELELTKAQTGYYEKRTPAENPNPSGSPMLDALGGDLYRKFRVPGRTSGTID